MIEPTDIGAPSWDAVDKATELGLLPKEVTAEEHMRHGRLMWELRDFIIGELTDVSIHYESLRKVIDGSSETMTHDDALEACIQAFHQEGTPYAELARAESRKVTGNLDATSLALMFHRHYEHLAPSFGYETRTKTRRFDPDSSNGKLMVATCAAILKELAGE